MKVEEILKGIFNVQFPNQEELASTFVRFAEYYQNPVFIGRTFTLDEFKEWYIANSKNGMRTGRFSYYQDRDGFSIPSYVLEPFYNGRFDPLSKEEMRLLNVNAFRKGERLIFILLEHLEMFLLQLKNMK